jgi:hypothetical protein
VRLIESELQQVQVAARRTFLLEEHYGASVRGDSGGKLRLAVLRQLLRLAGAVGSLPPKIEHAAAV